MAVPLSIYWVMIQSVLQGNSICFMLLLLSQSKKLLMFFGKRSLFY